MLCQETVLPFSPQKERINSTPLMQTPKQFVLLDNISAPLFFSGVIIFHISLIYLAALFCVHSFPIHNCKIKNTRFLADLSRQNSPNSTVFYKTDRNSNQGYIQRPSEEKQNHKQTPHTRIKQRSHKS